MFKKDVRPVIVVSGSQSTVSWDQIKYALEKSKDIGHITLNQLNILRSIRNRKEEIKIAYDQVETLLLEGKNLIISLDLQKISDKKLPLDRSLMMKKSNAHETGYPFILSLFSRAAISPSVILLAISEAILFRSSR